MHCCKAIRRIARIAVLLPVGLLVACEPSARSTSGFIPDGTRTLVPRSVAALDRQGTLLLDFRVNDTRVYQDVWTPGFTGALQVDASLMNQTLNKVDIAFSLQSTASATEQSIPLAAASHLIPAAAAGATITFPAIVYRYADSDNDGRFNIHELAISNSDIDADTIPNVFDTDSDNDGIEDGQDESPYGQLPDSETSGSNRSIDVLLPDNTKRQLSIDHVVGDPDELSHLVDTLGQVAINIPDNWPTSINDVAQFTGDAAANIDNSDNMALRGWTAFSLGGRNGSACPDWRLLLDASSLSNNTTQAVLLYFRLDDQQPQLAPLGATSISNLDEYNHTPPFDGNGPLNNSLRMILVPSSTLGWMELWTLPALEGEACNMNLATD